MEDPDAGGSTPRHGASPDFAPEDSDAQRPVNRASARQAGSAPPRGRPVRAPDEPKRGRKSRKRKQRGRKVYARDATAPAANPVAMGGAILSAATSGATPALRVVPAAIVPAPEAAAAASPPRVRPVQDQPLYAALDLGTNNCRLLIAVPTAQGSFRVVDAFSRIVRLGEGLTANGRLSEPAMRRAVEALKVCADKLGSRAIRSARLIATEACRSAENGAEFLERVKDQTGLELEVIDRETEARLAVSGCGSLIDPGTEGVVLFDIGGGSSEIALVDLTGARSPRLANHIRSWTSLPVGVVSLAERFGGRDVTAAVFDAMVADVARMIDRFQGRHRLAHVIGNGRFHLLGTSGTVTTLAGVHLGLERYDRRRVDGLWMSRAEVDLMMRRLRGWSFEERVANPCIGADRADLVLAGCAILEAIRRQWPSERLRVADRGLREGILTELMAADGAWRRDRRRSYA